jgi:single-stranded DNA-binding protein
VGIKITVEGWIGKDPYVQTIGDKKVVVLNLASRRPNSRHADWVTGTVWNEKLSQFVLSTFKKGDKIIAFGVMGKLGVYYSSDGKAKPVLDFFVNSIGFSASAKTEERDGTI